MVVSSVGAFAGVVMLGVLATTGVPVDLIDDVKGELARLPAGVVVLLLLGDAMPRRAKAASAEDGAAGEFDLRVWLTAVATEFCEPLNVLEGVVIAVGVDTCGGPGKDIPDVVVGAGILDKPRFVEPDKLVEGAFNPSKPAKGSSGS